MLLLRLRALSVSLVTSLHSFCTSLSLSRSHSEDDTPAMALEEALVKIAELIPSTTLELLDDKNWKQRLSAVEEIAAVVDSVVRASERVSDE